MTDRGASILAKLKSRARNININYQQCLQLFFQEEFLRRLSKSPYADNLILKGGLFIYTLTNFQSRATVDIDFTARQLDNAPERMSKVIAEIIAIPTSLNDVVLLEAGRLEPIAIERKYQGVSCQITGHIKKVRLPFAVDIGIGDVIIPRPKKRRIQTQLEGYEAPEIYTYSLESTIAEKFDAILQRFELTGRMKDFFDIYYLASTFDFQGQQLQEALSETLRNRKTEHGQGTFERVLQLAQDADIQARWRHFQKTINRAGLSLSDVMRLIGIFLRPVFEAVISGNRLPKIWNAGRQEWV